MRAARRIGPLVAALALAAGCGGGAKNTQTDDDDEIEQFKCNGRRGEYLVVGGFVAAELGIRIECEGDHPILTKWTVDDDGERDESEHVIGRANFNEIWRAFEDAGWRNLADCMNTAAKDDDQVYTFEVRNDDAQVTFVCQGKQLPFPFDRLVNALDVAAGEFN